MEWLTPQKRLGPTQNLRLSINKYCENRRQLRLVIPLSVLDAAGMTVGDRVLLGVAIIPKAEGVDIHLREDVQGYKISPAKRAGKIAHGFVSVVLPDGHPLERLSDRTLRDVTVTTDAGEIFATLK
jgi:hypothetical protein